MNTYLFGDWNKAQRALTAMGQLNQAIAESLYKEGEALRAEIVKGFTSQAPGGMPFKPLSAWTLAARRLQGFRGTKALIHTGEMRKSFVVKLDRAKLQVFVGILYQKKRKDGQKMVNIAKTHEFGLGPIMIPKTPKMQRFLAILAKEAGIKLSKGGGKGRSYVIINIPARPFMRPSAKKWSKGAPDRVQKAIERALKRMGV